MKFNRIDREPQAHKGDKSYDKSLINSKERAKPYTHVIEVQPKKSPPKDKASQILGLSAFEKKAAEAQIKLRKAGLVLGLDAKELQEVIKKSGPKSK